MIPISCFNFGKNPNITQVLNNKNEIFNSDIVPEWYGVCHGSGYFIREQPIYVTNVF